LSLVATTFRQGQERAKAFGIFSAIAMAGSAIGLLLGGVLTEYTWWRWASTSTSPSPSSRSVDHRDVRRCRRPLPAFVALEARTAHPLLPVRVVAERNRAGVYLGISLAMVGMFGQFLFLAYYFQLVQGWSPLVSGLAFMPMTICLTAGSTQIGARLTTRLPARALMVPGFWPPRPAWSSSPSSPPPARTGPT
jgi:MFS family permease